MDNSTFQIKEMYSAEAIDRVNRKLAGQISADYTESEPLLIGVLKGSFIFMADLCRLISVPCALDFISVSSYGDSTHSSGKLEIRMDLQCDIHGRDIIIIEDILDTGLTLSRLKSLFLSRGAKSVKICVFAVKYGDNGKPISDGIISADYAGFRVDNQFVIGYGLDYGERFRNLPFLGIL